MASTALLRRFPSPTVTISQRFHPLRPRTAMRVLAASNPSLGGASLRNFTHKTEGIGAERGLQTLRGGEVAREVESEPGSSASSALAFAVAMACAATTLLAPHESAAAVESGGEIVRLAAAELDPGTAKLAIEILGPVFTGFNLMFVVRIVMSWYPQLPVGKFPFSIAYAPTEPVLGPTRRLIPPVGGVDVAPVIWVAFMSFLNEILLGNQGLLVLLSQQQP